MAAKSGNAQSIYEQIGGMGTIDAVVEVMFSRVMGDLRIKHLFDGVTSTDCRAACATISRWSAAARTRFGKVDLKCRTRSAVGKGMNDTHFDAFAGHMQAALNALEVPTHLAAMIMAIVFASRDEIMGRAESGSSPVNAAAHAAAVPAGERGARAGSRACADAEAEAAAAGGQGRAPPRRPKLRDQGQRGRQPDHPRQRRAAREPDDDGQRAGADPQPAAADPAQARRTASSPRPLQRLNHVTSELQEGVMKTRMQPIGNAWAKLPRLVRDLATN